ncbi:MAG: hypothetical protein ACREVI_02355 [Steroidobacteraceae bacterium]
MEIRIDPRKVAVTLLVVAIVLICLHVGFMFSRYVLGHARLLGVIDTFNVNYENNVPTFFSAFMLVSCAALLAVIARQPAPRARDARYWGWLSVIFLLLALDEDASIHELWIGPLQYLLDADGALYFAWVIPYGIGLAVVGLLYLRFVLRLPEPTRRLTILAGSLYVAGAFGFELIGGWYVSQFDGHVDFPYSIIVAGEEFLEMCGTILFIYTLLDYLRRALGDEPIRVRFRSG